MKLRRLIAATAATGLLSLALTGAAHADSISVTDTGPGSTNQASVNNNSTVTQTNVNNATVTNVNTQTATTGAANVSGNTNAGSATSGNASNSNTTTTTVAINNPGLNVGGGSLGNGGGTVSPTSGGTGGGSLGKSGANVGGGTLPATGASDLVDVSALRNLLGAGQSATVAGDNHGLSASLLSLIAALSLVGAVGSAIYASKRAVV